MSNLPFTYSTISVDGLVKLIIGSVIAEFGRARAASVGLRVLDSIVDGCMYCASRMEERNEVVIQEGQCLIIEQSIFLQGIHLVC